VIAFARKTWARIARNNLALLTPICDAGEFLVAAFGDIGNPRSIGLKSLKAEIDWLFFNHRSFAVAVTIPDSRKSEVNLETFSI